jgi:hypothetical protein
VSPTQNRDSNGIDVLLQRRRGDHLWRLSQPGVNDFHAGVPQRSSNDFGSAVVAVKTWFRD